MKLQSTYINLLAAFAGLFILAVATPAVAYDPPAGIPAPMWGTLDPIEKAIPAQPSGWPGSEVTNYYYVDNTHPQATNSGNTFGYPDKPRATIPEFSLAAGSYVEIHGGTVADPYDDQGQIFLVADGTEADPVWIVGDATNKPILGGETIPKGQYLFIENLKWTGNRQTLSIRSHNSSTISYLSVRNCELSGPGTDVGNTAAIGIGGKSSTERFSNFVIYKTVIHGFGDDATSAGENDYHGILPGQNVDFVWILENEIYDMGGDSIQVSQEGVADETRPTRVYIGKNKMYSNHENAVDIKEADWVVISENLMYDMENVPSAAGEVVVVHFGPTKVWLINNVIHTGDYGFLVAGGEDIWAIGNVIYNIKHTSSSYSPNSLFSQGGGIHYRIEGSHPMTGGVVNNTIFNTDAPIQLPSGASGFTILNNALVNKAESLAPDIGTDSATVIALSTINNNLFYNGGADQERFKWGTTFTSLTDFKANTTLCANCIAGVDPQIEVTDTAKLGQFPFTSNARDAGVDITTILNSFETQFGFALESVDLYGNPRITNSTIDIGAFEYPKPTSLPNAPSGASTTVN